jgi:hypothetical protein
MGADPDQVQTRSDLHAALRKLFDDFEGSYNTLVADLGVAQSTVHGWVSGATFPRWQNLSIVLPKLGVHVDALPAWRRAHSRAQVAVPEELRSENLVRVQAAAGPELLPRDVPTFVGREGELAELSSLVGIGSASKVVLISGAAGVGKTAFAVHAAHSVQPRFPDGQLYADMHGYTEGKEPSEPSGVLTAFLSRLGTDRAVIPASVEDQSGLLRDLLAPKRVLILLDNVKNEAQIRPFLPGTGSSSVLITSRGPLMALDVDMRIDLDVLSHADATSLLEDLIGQERTHAEPEETDQVRDWCGCLPLALWIAGQLLAVHKTWPVSRLANMLADERQRLDRLAVGDRQVRAAFQTSYLHLADADTLMFRLLGLYPGSVISRSVAANLAGINERTAETILEHLVVAHLVNEVEAGRYVMHDLIRLFSREMCLMMTSGNGAALGLPTPLARLYAMALHGDINVIVHDNNDGIWPSDKVAALASYDNIVILNPLLEGDLQTDVLVFAISVCCSIVVGDTAPEGYVAAPDGYVAISRQRLAYPPKGPGRLATLFAQHCGRDIESANFHIFSNSAEYEDAIDL